MKFKIKIKEFMEGLEPAFIVATKGIARDWPTADLVTINVEKDRIYALANGGKMSISNEISKFTCSELGLEIEKGGGCTVRASDLKATLLSFSLTDEVDVETRTYSEPQKDAAETDEDDAAGGDDGDEEGKSNSGIELVFTLSNDPEQFQTVPCVRETIRVVQNVIDFMETQNKADAFSVKQNIFRYGASKVLFAHGFEEDRPTYLYWVLRADPDKVRFVAGTGQRFAVLDMEGKGATNAKSHKDLLVPNEQSAALLSIISAATYNNEHILFYIAPKFLVVEHSSFRVVVPNYDPDIKFVDENRFLERSNNLVLTTKVSDWQNVVRGITATFSQEMKKQHDYHFATLDINFGKQEILAKSEGIMKSNRKIPIQNSDVATDLAQDGHMTFEFVSLYLAEAIKYADGGEHIQIELEKPNYPIIFRYHADSQGKVGDPKTFNRPDVFPEMNERFAVFFSPRKKKKAEPVGV